MARGVLYAPDYVVNAGGLIDVSSALNTYVLEDSLGHVARIYGRLLEIFERAAAEGRSTAAIADRMAEERFLRPSPIHSQAA